MSNTSHFSYSSILAALETCGPIITKMAYRYHLDRDDAQQEAALALLNAWNTTLAPYHDEIPRALALTIVHRKLCTWLQRELRGRRPLSLDMPGEDGGSLQDILYAPSEDEPPLSCQGHIEQEALHEALLQLSPQERAYLVQRFEIDTLRDDTQLPPSGTREFENVRDGAKRHLRANEQLKAVLA